MKKKFIEKLKRGLEKEEFLKYIKELYPDFNLESAIDFLKFQGLPLTIDNNFVILKTAVTPYKEFEYCVVDIEVNNSKPSIGQVIEIGAVKIKNLQIVDIFEFLINVDFSLSTRIPVELYEIFELSIINVEFSETIPSHILLSIVDVEMLKFDAFM